jgi:thymidylate synthase (FAD)
MIVTVPYAVILPPLPDPVEVLKTIEMYGRVSYKSEHKQTETSAPRFVKMLLDAGHESVIEHVSVSVKFVVDRGVSHEIVRHRLASYTQESTRYCDYVKKGSVEFIRPCFWAEDSMQYRLWREQMQMAEDAYNGLRNLGAPAQEARSVLPNSLKTELIMTANLREWRHFFKLRTANPAHPQMREVARPLLKDFQSAIPVVFDDIIVS